MSRDWVESELARDVEITTGFPFASSRYATDGIRLLRGDNIGQGRIRWAGVKMWPASDSETHPRYELSAGDVVLAMDRPWIQAGLKYAILTEADVPALLVQRVARLRGRSELDTRFLGYLIASRRFTEHVLGVQTGTAVPHVSARQIGEFWYLRPPIEEQRAIASVLGALDDKIELNRRMNETLEALARAIFTSWFVDFDPVRARAEGRQPVGMDAEAASLFPDSFEDSPLGPIPSGWHVGELGDVVSMNTRSRLSEYPHREIKYVDIASVTKGRLEATAPMPLDEAPSRARRLVTDGDVIWSCVRPNRRSYLRIDHPPDNLVVSTGFVVLTPTAVPSSYLYLSVTTDEFVDYLTANADGSAYPAVRPEHFDRSPMLIPEKAPLLAFDDRVAPLLGRIALNERESNTLAGTRDALLPKLVSGAIRIASDT